MNQKKQKYGTVEKRANFIDPKNTGPPKKKYECFKGEVT